MASRGVEIDDTRVRLRCEYQAVLATDLLTSVVRRAA